MSRSFGARVLLTTVLAAATGVALSADTLVMRDGRRVTGEVVAMRGDTIEFREQGVYNSRTLRVSRQDVRAIEFDDFYGEERGGRYGSGTAGRRPGTGTGTGPGVGVGSRPGERPAAMRERNIVVRGDAGWVDTGIDVREGQALYFDARGEVGWAPALRSGPRGDPSSVRNPNRPMPNRPGGSLVGRVGSGDIFFIGDARGPIRVYGSGRLFLGVNDDYVRDNQGAFSVVVYH